MKSRLLLIPTCVVVLGLVLVSIVTTAIAQTTIKPKSTTSPAATSATRTPDQDRVHLISILQKRFPALAIDDWSQGSSAITPGVAVTPLGGTNATNVNDILAIGQKQWLQKFKNGKSMASCFTNSPASASASTRNKTTNNIAATYPQFDATTGMVISLEMAVQQCFSANNEIAPTDPMQFGALIAYIRSLAIGQKLNVRVATPAALERYQAGRTWFSRRIGEKDKACASCHVLQAGETVDGVVYSPAVGQVLAWPRIEPGGNVRLLHQQFQRCMQRVGAEPFALGSPVFNDLEYFLSSISNGLNIRPPIPTR
jgi:L-cysteine S-thiosulfotransferase